MFSIMAFAAALLSSNWHAVAVRERLRVHIRHDNCVVLNSVNFAAQAEPAETIAEAVLGVCSKIASELQFKTEYQFQDLPEYRRKIEAEKLMIIWMEVAKRNAITCIVVSRSDPSRIGRDVCKARLN